MTREVNSYEEFKEEIEKGGFILAHWDGTTETEEKILARLEQTKRELTSLGDYDYVIYNYTDGVEACAEDIRAIVRAECAALSRNADAATRYFKSK